ncbi:MAG: hypothetical protein M1828_002956 [Chrysothrix sp. TS-e1954]|nr:MAG: hypothetical protein M1828_002956 [Chrysothrix sp. TS-e1954]
MADTAANSIVDYKAAASQSPVVVSLEDLKQESISLASLEEAFGPSSLGIIVVKDLPERYAELRNRVLSYSSYLANLPSRELEKLEQPQAKYLTGWSLGKETLKSGHFDTLKGSYYVNCAFYRDPALQSAPAENYPDFSEYTSPNVWPVEDVLPGFRDACEQLCALVIDTAVLVARACDRYGEARVPGYGAGYLEKMVKTSMTTKARLLHYFPSEGPEDGAAGDNGEEDDWCATHVDHGCLTGLTSAMYVDESAHAPKIPRSVSRDRPLGTPQPIPELDISPDPTAGLYIHSRQGTVTQVRIPRDCLAFQTGEALEVITKGRFRAVPHYVKGISKGTAKGSKVARNTLAVFTQPNLWEIVDRERGQDFAGFARSVVERTY